MPAFVKGFQRRLYYGSAGSAATIPVLNATDVDVGGGHTRSETTVRGTGTSVPLHTEQVTQLNRPVTFKTRYKSDDTAVAALIAAEKEGADIAIKVTRYDAGPVEANYDATLILNSPGPLAENMILEWEAVPSRDSGREPALT